MPGVIVNDTQPVPARNQAPGTIESITARQLSETVNLMNAEDGFAYTGFILMIDGEARVSVHAAAYSDYSTGTRCCRDAE